MTAPALPQTGREPLLLAGPHQHSPRCWWDLRAAAWHCGPDVPDVPAPAAASDSTPAAAG